MAPKVKKSTSRTRTIAVKVNAATAAHLKQQARNKGVSLSRLIHDAVLPEVPEVPTVEPPVSLDDL